MKKGIVIALAIAIVFLFTGCGIQNQLSGTKWQNSGAYYWFNSDGTYEVYDTFYTTGTWFCEGHELHMKPKGSSVGTIYDASISGNTLTLKDKLGSSFIELYRVE